MLSIVIYLQNSVKFYLVTNINSNINHKYANKILNFLLLLLQDLKPVFERKSVKGNDNLSSLSYKFFCF